MFNENRFTTVYNTWIILFVVPSTKRGDNIQLHIYTKYPYEFLCSNRFSFIGSEHFLLLFFFFIQTYIPPYYPCSFPSLCPLGRRMYDFRRNATRVTRSTTPPPTTTVNG